MTTKHSTAQPVTDTRPIARTVRGMRMEAFTLRVVAAGIVGGAVVAAVWFETPALAFAGLVALWPALSAHWLADLAARTAEALPPKPKRAGPHWLRRVWRRYVAWRMVRAMQPQPIKPPYRVVNEGKANEFYMPHQPGEMRSARERVIVAGYTASDVFEVVRDAAIYGLHERALKKDGKTRAWKFGPQERRVLPSGKQLSRDGFRDVQRYLVAQGWATADPSYRLIVTPEEIGRELEKAK